MRGMMMQESLVDTGKYKHLKDDNPSKKPTG